MSRFQATRTCSQPEVVVTPARDSSGPGPSGMHVPVYKRISGSVGEVVLHSGGEEESAMHQLKNLNRWAESTRSLSYLEWVHERQTKRMHTRSEWFLSPVLPNKNSNATKSVSDFLQHQVSVEAKPQITPVLKGVARKRSWRKHYVRPKTFDCPETEGSEASIESAPATPLNTPEVPAGLLLSNLDHDSDRACSSVSPLSVRTHHETPSPLASPAEVEEERVGGAQMVCFRF